MQPSAAAPPSGYHAPQSCAIFMVRTPAEKTVLDVAADEEDDEKEDSFARALKAAEERAEEGKRGK